MSGRVIRASGPNCRPAIWRVFELDEDPGQIVADCERNAVGDRPRVSARVSALTDGSDIYVFAGDVTVAIPIAVVFEILKQRELASADESAAEDSIGAESTQ